MIKPRRKPETAEETAKRLEAEEKFKKEEAIKNMKTSLQKLSELEKDVKNGTLSANRHFGTAEYWFDEAIMTDRGKFADRGWFIYLSEENKKEYIQKVIEVAESIGFNLEYYYTKSTGIFESVIKDMILESLATEEEKDAENPMKIKEIKETRQIRYRKKNLIQKAFLFNRKTDSDILQKLSAVENQTGYIKELIRKDIRGNSNDNQA